ncbi:MAG: DUF3050 domain-containing protein [Planctomycetota bacterium]|jgi:hypothetical protein
MPMHELQPIESPNPWIAPAALRELQRLEAHLEPLRRRLLEADVYASVADMDALRRLTEHHVFAVWDFMSLVKRLQGELTCMQQPWRPVGDPELRRTITEIVLEEECDRDPQGNAISHFELYLEAMRRLGANPSAAKRLVAALDRGRDPRTALAECGAPEPALAFSRVTLELAAHEHPAAAAAAFAFGREEVIPDMFRRFLERLGNEPGDPAAWLRFYLDRHVELDGDAHGPAAERIVAHLCGDDPEAWRVARWAAERALTARCELWEAVAGPAADPACAVGS